MITVKADGVSRQFPEGVRYKEIAEAYQSLERYPILLVSSGNKLRELGKQLTHDAELTFITMADKIGRDTYARSLVLMMLKAFQNVIGAEEEVHIWVHFTVSQGLFCSMKSERTKLDEQLLNRVCLEMKRLAELKIPFEKRSMETSKAARLFAQNRMDDKARLFRYRISSRTNVYSFDGTWCRIHPTCSILT